MTLPDERTRAVLDARAFLMKLLSAKATPRVPAPLRREAGMLLRHFPTVLDMMKADSFDWDLAEREPWRAYHDGPCQDDPCPTCSQAGDIS